MRDRRSLRSPFIVRHRHGLRPRRQARRVREPVDNAQHSTGCEIIQREMLRQGAVHRRLSIGNALATGKKGPLPDGKAVSIEGAVFPGRSNDERQWYGVRRAAVRVECDPADTPVVSRDHDLIESNLTAVHRWNDLSAGRRGDPKPPTTVHDGATIELLSAATARRQRDDSSAD